MPSASFISLGKYIVAPPLLHTRTFRFSPFTLATVPSTCITGEFSRVRNKWSCSSFAFRKNSRHRLLIIPTDGRSFPSVSSERKRKFFPATRCTGYSSGTETLSSIPHNSRHFPLPQKRRKGPNGLFSCHSIRQYDIR